MTELSLQNIPLDDDMIEEEPEDELASSGMRVVESDEDIEDEEAKPVADVDDPEKDPEEVKVAAEDDDEPKDGLEELEKMAEALDEPPIDMGLDE